MPSSVLRIKSWSIFTTRLSETFSSEGTRPTRVDIRTRLVTCPARTAVAGEAEAGAAPGQRTRREAVRTAHPSFLIIDGIASG
jgi:hypothetical protein